MNKKTILLFLVLLVFISSISIVSAHFPPPHIASTYKAVNTQPDTEYKRICREKLVVVRALWSHPLLRRRKRGGIRVNRG